MKIGIVGFGHVGQAVAEGLYVKGDHEIWVNEKKEELSQLFDGVQWHNGPAPAPLAFVDKEELVKQCEVIFICVQTPSLPDGSCDLTHVAKVFEELWHHASLNRLNPVIVIKSTCIPDTLNSFLAGYKMMCANPEFMRVNSALEDFLNPDRIVIGADSPEVFEIMRKVYAAWEAPIMEMRPSEAELVKYLANAYLVGKVGFAETSFRICDMLRVDPVTVMDAVTADERINKSHLNPLLGRIPRNSHCLPKDLKALVVQLEKSKQHPELLQAYFSSGVESEIEERLMEVLSASLEPAQALKLVSALKKVIK